MGRYVLSAPAKSDIREIVACIRQRNPDVAKRVRRELQEKMRRLSDFPGMLRVLFVDPDVLIGGEGIELGEPYV